MPRKKRRKPSADRPPPPYVYSETIPPVGAPAGCYFSEERAAAAVEFIERLRHTKGKYAGSPFLLRKWQKEPIRYVFGWRRPDGTRLTRYLWLAVARKNGKSELAAAIALLLLFGDGEEGAEIYGAAFDREQASIVFRVAASMVRRSNTLRKLAKIIDSQRRIVVERTGSFYMAIPADAAGSHGFNASGIVFDEVHTQKTRDLWDVLVQSIGARSQPLIVGITTAGFDTESICYEMHEYAQKLRDGIIKDPEFYPVIFEAHPDDDWTKRETWLKANPALGDFRSEEELAAAVSRARHMPASQNSIRRFYMNIWTAQAERFVDMTLWRMQAGATVNPSDLVGLRMHGGLDLSTVRDMTAWVMVFDDAEDPDLVYVVARFWVPEVRLHDESNRYRASYQKWARLGELTVIEGNAIDYDVVEKQVVEDCSKFGVETLAIDRLFQSHSIGMRLADELGEDKVVAMGQGFISYGPAMKEFERLLLLQKIQHGGNTLMTWHMDNLSVLTDAAGNHKPDKGPIERSQKRIDGASALAMALDRRARWEDTSSVYDRQGVRGVG